MMTSSIKFKTDERFPSDHTGRGLTLVVAQYQNPAASFAGGLVF